MLPSEKVPVAVNCWVVPRAILRLVGVTAMDTSEAAVTVRVVVPEIVPDVAVIVVEPVAAGVANPCEPAALLMAATPVLDELHAAAVVRFWVLPSENVPVATNCWVVPRAMLWFVGVIANETSVAGVTVTEVVPEIVVDPEVCPQVALTVVLPVCLPQICPQWPDIDLKLSIVTTFVSDELQVTESVRSFVELSE